MMCKFHTMAESFRRVRLYFAAFFIVMAVWPFTCLKAQDDLDSLKRLIKTDLHDTSKLYHMALILENVIPGDSVSLYYNEQIKQLATKNLQSKDLSLNLKKRYLCYLGIYYANKSVRLSRIDPIQSINFSFKATTLFKSIGYYTEMSYSLINEGITYSQMANYEKAIECCFEALKFFEKNGDTDGIIYATGLIASIYQDQKEDQKSIPYYKKILTYYDTLTELTIEDRIQQAITNHNIGSAYLNTGNYDEAEKYLGIALKEARENKSNSVISPALDKLGRIYQKRGKNETALMYFDQALKIAETDAYKANVLISIGELYFEEKQYVKSISFLEQALVLSQTGRSLELQERACEYLYKAYKYIKQFDKSLRMHEMYMAIKDSAKVEASKDLLKEQQYKYEFEKRELKNRALQEKKIEALKFENERKQTRKNVLLFTAVMLALFLLIVILFLFNYFRQKNKIALGKNNELKQKLLLTQMNPHFIFNSVDSIQSLIYQKQDKKAILYLTKFSKLTRQILENSTENYISLTEELSILDNFMTIQQLLHNNSFSYTIVADKAIDADTVMVPPMLTQPFVENAIKHGLKHKVTDGIVNIYFYMKNNALFFEVTDNGKGIEANTEVKTHKSLSTQITQERLNNNLHKKVITIHTCNITDANNHILGVKTSFEMPYVYDR